MQKAYDPRERLVHKLIAEQAARTPNKLAAVCEGRSLTFAALLDYADRLAAALTNAGIGKGGVVALLLEHSLETLVSIIAVLRTGAAYLPIDPAYPKERIRYVLEDSEAGLLLHNVGLPEGIGDPGNIMQMNMPMIESLPRAEQPPDVAISPQDPVYIIYTSGSTGQPKGVVIRHQGLMNYTWWARQTYYPDECDVAALYSSLAFDLTMTAIFPPLINGNTVAIYPASKDGFVLDRILSDKLATVLKLTPAHLALINNRDNSASTVRMLIVGGENLKSAVAADIHRSFAGKAALINEYGPTETVVGCIVHRFDPAADLEGSVPIGRPIANTRVYLLDDTLQPVPEGVIGEIYIAGDGVAAGYWRRPELTEARFVPDPFTGGGTMYKTDDLALLRPDGSIEYIGRSDSQIKLNGYRIELGEIENHLMRLSGIAEAVVTVYRNEMGVSALAAYLATRRKDLDSFTVRQTLLDWMPAYMVPHYVVLLDKLPMTTNGKVDRKALPDPEAAAARLAPAAVPKERQELLLQIISDVLQTGPISLRDNFYRLGGDSIKALRVMAKLHEAGFSVQLKDMMSFPVIGELACSIEQTGCAAEGQEQELPYWEQVVRAVEPPLQADSAHAAGTKGGMETLHAELVSEVTAKLLTSANHAYNTRLADLLVAALALACRAMSGKRQFTIQMETYGRDPTRDPVNIPRSAGSFISLFPVRFELPDAGVGEQLKAVKEQLRAVPNQGIGYAALVLAGKLPAWTARTIRFHDWGEIDERLPAGSLLEQAEEAGGQAQDAGKACPNLLEVVPFVQDKRFKLEVTYSLSDFRPETVQLFMRHYMEQLQLLIGHCSDKTDTEYTPSDFDTASLNQNQLDSLFF